MQIELHSLSCPSCNARHTLTEVFDNCSRSWPEQRLLYFDCPKCRQTRHVQVHDDCVALGYLDPLPGPRFVTQQELVQAGLSSVASEHGLEVRLHDHTWFIEARE